eukprot:577926-Pelagomonas_calceolata.AAC.4
MEGAAHPSFFIYTQEHAHLKAPCLDDAQLRSAPCATNREDVRGPCLTCACSWTQLRGAPRTAHTLGRGGTLLTCACSQMQLRSAPCTSTH